MLGGSQERPQGSAQQPTRRLAISPVCLPFSARLDESLTCNLLLCGNGQDPRRSTSPIGLAHMFEGLLTQISLLHGASRCSGLHMSGLV